MISVLILTLDEEVNIGECISSVPWREDVHVVDSGSLDKTLQIASEMGARVHEHKFKDYADQRSFGLSLPFCHEWILMIDADERVTSDLADEIENNVRAAPPHVDMFRVRRKDIFHGRWLRRSSGYPTWFPRLMRRGRVTVSRAVNETYACDGKIESLTHHLIHYPFNKGIDWWFDRHGRYSSSEAALLLSAHENVGVNLKNIISFDPMKRRAACKQLAYALPFRPFLVFLYLYFFRLGLLDGAPGYHFACMRMAYEIMIDSKVAFRRSLLRR